MRWSQTDDRAHAPRPRLREYALGPGARASTQMPRPNHVSARSLSPRAAVVRPAAAGRLSRSRSRAAVDHVAARGHMRSRSRARLRCPREREGGSRPERRDVPARRHERDCRFPGDSTLVAQTEHASSGLIGGATDSRRVARLGQRQGGSSTRRPRTVRGEEADRPCSAWAPRATSVLRVHPARFRTDRVTHADTIALIAHPCAMTCPRARTSKAWSRAAECPPVVLRNAVQQTHSTHGRAARRPGNPEPRTAGVPAIAGLGAAAARGILRTSWDVLGLLPANRGFSPRLRRHGAYSASRTTIDALPERSGPMKRWPASWHAPLRRAAPEPSQARRRASRASRT